MGGWLFMAALQMACGDTLLVKNFKKILQRANLAMEMGQNNNPKTENAQRLL